MRLKIDLPCLHVAIPEGSRVRKAVWTREATSLDIPEHDSGDIVSAVSYRQAPADPVTTIFRIDDVHYRPAKINQDNSPFQDRQAAGEPDWARKVKKIIVANAREWARINLDENMKPFPEDAHPSRIEGLLSRLYRTDELQMKDIDQESTASFQNQISSIANGFALIDGDLYERCAEPTYAVSIYGAVSTVQVMATRWPELKKTTVALFPIGKFEEAVAFARDTYGTPEIAFAGAVADLNDCGECLSDDTHERSLVIAARNAVTGFEEHFAADYVPKSRTKELLHETDLEDLSLHRYITKSLHGYDNAGYFNLDELSFSLRQAANGASKAIFSWNGRFPLEQVADLWDDRPISVQSMPPTNPRSR